MHFVYYYLSHDYSSIGMCTRYLEASTSRREPIAEVGVVYYVQLRWCVQATCVDVSSGSHLTTSERRISINSVYSAAFCLWSWYVSIINRYMCC